MAIGVVFELDGVHQETYDQIADALSGGTGLESPSDWPVPGLLAHLAGPTANGWRVCEVWESEEAFARFGEKLTPLAQQAGIQVRPDVFQLHNFVK